MKRGVLDLEGPDARTRLKAGDPVYADPSWASPSWATDWIPPAGAQLRLGTVELDEDEPDWTRRHRIRLDHEPGQLQQVAVRFPDDAPRPYAQSTRPIGARVLATPLGTARDVFLIGVGREAGVEVGQAVVDGHRILGRVHSVGWRSSRVEGVRDPGGRWTALRFEGDEVHPTQLSIDDQGHFAGDETKPEVVVATGFADPWIPVGLWLESEDGAVIWSPPSEVAVLAAVEGSP